MSNSVQTPQQEIRMLQDLGVAVDETTTFIDATPKEEVAIPVNTGNELARMLGEIPQQEAPKVATKEEAVEQYPLGHKVQLKRPIVNSVGKEITELSFDYEITGETMSIIPLSEDKMTWNHQLALIGACTGLPSQDLVKLKSPDVIALTGVASSFFVHGPLIG